MSVSDIKFINIEMKISIGINDRYNNLIGICGYYNFDFI